MCACQAADCVDAIEGEIERALQPLSDEAGPVVRDAAGDMIDELGSCSRRVRMKLDLARPEAADKVDAKTTP